MKNYHDISVHISPEIDGSYPIRVESSLTGAQGHSTLKLPFSLADLTGVVFGVSETTREASVSIDGEDDRMEPRKRPADYGVELFEALFQGESRDLLAHAVGDAQNSVDKGVRIRLSMNLQEQGMAAVANLPWELMCREGQRPLVVSQQTPLVRSLDTPRPAKPRPFRAPLRILALMSNPSGTGKLDLEAERIAIEKNWAKLPGVEVDFVQPVERIIRDQLVKEDYHVIHYMGHGGFDADAGGSLMLETEDGKPHQVSSDKFAMWLADEPLRLVFLNACKTGTTNLHENSHPFAGVATALIREQIPAVIAMQFPISDQAAITFSETFYKCIAAGLAVDAAVAEGRKDLYLSEQSEWATPVLYLRSKDGMLFQPVNAEATQVELEPDSDMTGSEDPWGSVTESQLRVFLATPDQDREKLHTQLARSLAEMDDVKVISSVPLDEENHDKMVDSLIRGADICIHLLGANPGRRIDVDDGQPLRTYPLMQLDIGLKAARSQLVIITRADKESIANEAYAVKVDELTRLPRGKSRFELVMTDKNRVESSIRDKLEEERKKRQTVETVNTIEATGRQAFIDSHINDGEIAIELVSYLEERNIGTAMRTGSSPAADFEQLDENVGKYPLYVIVAGNVDKDWVRSRKVAVLKSAMRAKAGLLIAKYNAVPGENTENFEVTKSQFEISPLKDSDPSWFNALFSPTGTETP